MSEQTLNRGSSVTAEARPIIGRDVFRREGDQLRPISDRDIAADAYAKGFRDGHAEALSATLAVTV